MLSFLKIFLIYPNILSVWCLIYGTLLGLNTGVINCVLCYKYLIILTLVHSCRNGAREEGQHAVTPRRSGQHFLLWPDRPTGHLTNVHVTGTVPVQTPFALPFLPELSCRRSSVVSKLPFGCNRVDSVLLLFCWSLFFVFPPPLAHKIELSNTLNPYVVLFVFIFYFFREPCESSTMLFMC